VVPEMEYEVGCPTFRGFRKPKSPSTMWRMQENEETSKWYDDGVKSSM